MLLKKIFSRLRYLLSLTADKGRQFVGNEFKSFCRESIRLYNISPYWFQQMNVEGQNRDILKRLKISQFEKKSLKESIWDYVMLYNSTLYLTTGKSPSEFFSGLQKRDKIPSFESVSYRKENSKVREKERERNKEQKEVQGNKV